jgi:hypothetical protein
LDAALPCPTLDGTAVWRIGNLSIIGAKLRGRLASRGLRAAACYVAILRDAPPGCNLGES